MKKTYLSRSEAAKKYNVSIAKLRRWEQKGVLHRVQTYLTDYEAARAGAPVKWVYDEEELAALTKTSPAVSCVLQNIEAKVFRLLEKSTNGIEIARQTKLPIAEVQRLRAIYVEEVGAMFVSEKIVNKLRKKFILETPDDFVRIMLWHYEKVRELRGQLEIALTGDPAAGKKLLSQPYITDRKITDDMDE